MATLTFKADAIPDLTGKVAIVTGANVGIGLETAYFLASHNATVYIASRTESKAQAAIDTIKSRLSVLKTPITPTIHFLHLDLASVKAAKASAEEFLSKETRLDILICNAGAIGIKWTAEWAYEPMFYTNHLGHFAFVTTLLPLIETTAKATNDVRIVIVSSMALLTSKGVIDYSTITTRPENADGPRNMGMFPANFKLYGQSKLANVWFAKELDKRLNGSERGIWVNAVHPGWVGGTDLGLEFEDATNKLLGRVVMAVQNNVAMSTADGAATQTYVATAPEVAEYKIHGQYLVPRKNWLFKYQGPQVSPLEKVYQNEEEWKKLWEWSEEAVAKELAK